MKRRIDQEELLNDVLAGKSEADRNDVALDQLLRLARRRRRTRQGQRVGFALAVVAVLGVLGWLQFNPRRPQTELAREPAMAPGFETVTSVALRLDQWVNSQPLAAEQWGATVAETVTVVQTTATVPAVNDEELLELAKPNIAVLVRRGPRDAELVFVEPQADQN
jgi:hypothetical protein